MPCGGKAALYLRCMGSWKLQPSHCFLGPMSFILRWWWGYLHKPQGYNTLQRRRDIIPQPASLPRNLPETILLPFWLLLLPPSPQAGLDFLCASVPSLSSQPPPISLSSFFISPASHQLLELSFTLLHSLLSVTTPCLKKLGPWESLISHPGLLTASISFEFPWDRLPKLPCCWGYHGCTLLPLLSRSHSAPPKWVLLVGPTPPGRSSPGSLPQLYMGYLHYFHISNVILVVV